jgi:O-antigen/teichoic acid export membrane protein
MNRKRLSLSAPAKAAIWFTVCSFLQKGILAITTPIFTRLLTTQEYGIYTLYQSWFSVITILCTLNLSYNVFHRAMVKYPKDKDGYTASMQSLTILITLVVFLTFFIFPHAWEHLMRLPASLIFCMFLEMLFSPAFYFWQTRQRFEYKYIALAIDTVILTIGGTVLGVIAVIATRGGAAARIFPVVALDILFGLFFMILQYVRGRKFYSREYWKFALAFNLPLLPHYLSTVVLNQADRMIIGSLCGHNEVAYYGVAYSLAMASSLFISSVNSSLIPWTYKQMATGDEKQIRRIGHVGFMLSAVLAGILLLIIGFGPEIMLFLAPAKYQSAVWVIPPVALSVLASMYVWLFVNVETYYEENGYVALVSIAAAVLNVVLNYIFIPLFGYLAAGWTTLIAYVLMAYGHAFFTHRIRLHHDDINAYNVKKLSLLLITIMALAFVFMGLYQTRIIRYMMIALLCVVAVWQRKQIMKALAILRGSR